MFYRLSFTKIITEIGSYILVPIYTMTTSCCAECGKEVEGEGEGVASLKTCKSCLQVKYCNERQEKKEVNIPQLNVSDKCE